MRARILIVAASADRLPHVEHMTAARYLAAEDESDRAGTTVLNLARSDRYLSEGYYVSLLADARGQVVLPTIDTLEALCNVPEALRLLEDAGVPTLPSDPDERRETLLRLAKGAEVEVVEAVSIFGRADRADLSRVAAKIHRRFPLPAALLRFARLEGTLRLFHLEALPLERLDASQQEALARAASEGKLGAEGPLQPLVAGRPSLAVLFDPDDPFKPSYPETLAKLERVADRQGVRLTRIGPTEIDRVAEHDALFIRTLTGPHMPAFRFAQRAESLGIPVIDSTRAILRCGNKVYLFELLERAGVPIPATAIVVATTTYDEVVASVGSPLVLKVPDGSFSAAVFKIPSADAWERTVPGLLESSPLLLAQSWTPTDFDWRIGVLDGKPLFAARYWMVPGHWQIRRAGRTDAAAAKNGRTEAVPLESAPPAVIRAACRAAKLIGDELYGVDVKELEKGPVIIEINDNPDLHVDYEDKAEGDRIYEQLIAWFVKRIAQERTVVPRGAAPRGTELPPPPGPGALVPIGRPPTPATRQYRAYEVVGLEVEYALVDENLEPAHCAEVTLAALGGRPTSEVDLGAVAFSNEFFDHLVEIKTQHPLSSLVESEAVLAEGVARLADTLETRFSLKPMPTSMHPWFDPRSAVRWSRSGRSVYETYARLFDTATHGWANVTSCQVNLPLGREHEAIAMMKAAALLVPYLPAVAASSPMYDGRLMPAVDNRLAFILEHQIRIKETQGPMVPEYVESMAGYRRDIIRPMYKAVDALHDASPIRHEWLNARGAVFKLSRQSMEMRVIDSQECVHMDVAIAAFVRGALHDLSAELIRGRLVLPDHARLVEDLHACVAGGTKARVWAPHVAGLDRDGDGRASVTDVLARMAQRARRRLRRGERDYIDRVDEILRDGTLSERMRAHLAPHEDDEDALREAARALYSELSVCLVENRPWAGRAHPPSA